MSLGVGPRRMLALRLNCCTFDGDVLAGDKEAREHARMVARDMRAGIGTSVALTIGLLKSRMETGQRLALCTFPSEVPLS